MDPSYLSHAMLLGVLIETNWVTIQKKKKGHFQCGLHCNACKLEPVYNMELGVLTSIMRGIWYMHKPRSIRKQLVVIRNNLCVASVW